MRPDLSDLARRARRRLRDPAEVTPGRPPRTLDPGNRELLHHSPVFDQAWVEAQLATSFASVDEAIDAYLATSGCSPHPLFLPDFVRAHMHNASNLLDPLAWLMRKSRADRPVQTHPLVDEVALAAALPPGERAPHGQLLAWLETATPDTPVPVPAGYAPTTLGEVGARSLEALAAWREDLTARTAPRTSAEAPVAPAEPGAAGASDGTALGASTAPTVSIVMPMWNRGHVVRAAIASVQAQTLTDWELLVVDDGSTDDGLQVVRGIAHFDPRVVVVEAPHGGVSRARNEALARARGTYVAFLDTDNSWTPDFLRVMVAAMDGHDWTMAHGALRASTADGTYYRAHEGTLEQLLVANHVDLNVLVVRAEVVREVGGFDESLRRGVDWDLVLRLARHTGLHLVQHVGVDYEDGSTPGPRISDSEPSTWLSVVASKHLVEHHALEGPRSRSTSLVVQAPRSLRAVSAWVELAASAEDLELVLVGVRLDLLKHVGLQLMADAVGGRLVRLQVDRGPETSVNVGLAAARGARAVVVVGPVVLDASAVEALAGALDDPAVAVAVPVVLDGQGLVASAGATFGGVALPVPFLHGHATSDLPAQDVDLPAAMGPVLAGRTQELLDVGGLDPLCDGELAETDLTRRLARADGRPVRLLTSCRVVEGKPATTARPGKDGGRLASHDGRRPRLAQVGRLLALRAGADDSVRRESREAWRLAGFEVVGHDYPLLAPRDPDPLDEPVRTARPHLRPLRAEVGEGPPRLRWTIDLAVTGGRRGLSWGDTYFGAHLADALRGLGQHVAVDARDTRHRATRDLDDVVLTLRGLDRVAARPGPLNVMWVISHPDEVAPEEVAGYDLLFAASTLWAAQRSKDWARPVHPLLQATDATVFDVDADRFDTGPEVLFVGNSRQVYRSSLRHARSAGLDVEVHGVGWEKIIGAEAVTSRFVANDRLGAAYGAAGVVLNDHWEDMRVGGFVSNRLMDAAATGARVATDEVPGADLDALFHGLVRTYRTPAELAALVRDRDRVYPSAPDRLAAAQQVAREHSFAVRAATLVESVTTRWAARP